MLRLAVPVEVSYAVRVMWVVIKLVKPPYLYILKLLKLSFVLWRVSVFKRFFHSTWFPLGHQSFINCIHQSLLVTVCAYMRGCVGACVQACRAFNPVTIHLSDRASESSHVRSDTCCSKEATFLSTQNVNKPKTKCRPDIVVSSLCGC